MKIKVQLTKRLQNFIKQKNIQYKNKNFQQ